MMDIALKKSTVRTVKLVVASHKSISLIKLQTWLLQYRQWRDKLAPGTSLCFKGIGNRTQSVTLAPHSMWFTNEDVCRTLLA